MTPTREQVFRYLDWQDRTDAAIAHEVDSICAASPLVAPAPLISLEWSPAEVLMLSRMAAQAPHAQDEPASLRRYLSEDRKQQAEFRNQRAQHDQPQMTINPRYLVLAIGISLVIYGLIAGAIMTVRALWH